MLSFETLKLQKTGGDPKSLEKYFTQSAEYYRSGENRILPQGKWVGGLENRFDLNNPNRNHQKDLGLLTAGFDPNTKEGLVQNAGKANKIKCYDLTFNADKTFSIAFMRADKEERDRMLEAQHRAVEKALNYIKDNLHTRAGKGGVREVDIEELAIWQIDHFDSRKGDPHLHTHNVLCNVGLDQDGKTRALNGRTLAHIAYSAGAVYDRELASEFQKLGYDIVRKREVDIDGRITISKERKKARVAGHTTFKLQGIGDRLTEAFSKRHAEIVEKQKQHKKDRNGNEIETTFTAKEAVKFTRNAKTKFNEPELVIQQGNKAFNDMNGKMGFGWVSTDDLKAFTKNKPNLQRQKDNVKEFNKTIEDMVEELHDKHKTFTEFDLVEKLAYELDYGKDPVIEARKWIDTQLEQGLLLEHNGKETYREFITKARYDIPKLTNSTAIEMTVNKPHDLDKTFSNKGIKSREKAGGFSFSQEQKQAVEGLCSHSGGFGMLIGDAGTGKTAIIGAVVEAHKEAGYEIYGTAPSDNATEELHDKTGLSCKNIDQMLWALKKEKIQFTDKTLLLVDEAGMVGDQKFNQLLNYVNEAGGKMIPIGDPKQLKAIQTGDPMGELEKNKNIPRYRLTQVRRQQNEIGKALSMAFSNGDKGTEIVQMLEDNNQLSNQKDMKGKIEACVMDYVNNGDKAQDKLILCQTWKDINKLTDRLREELKADGQIEKNGVEVSTLRRTGKYEKKEFCEGDRIRFETPDRKLGVNNNDLGTVARIGIDERTHQPILGVILDKDKSKTIRKVDTAKYDRINHGWAGTVHSSQGQGKNSVYWLVSGGSPLNRNLGYVASSRMIKNFKCYTTTRDKNNLGKQLDIEAHKQNNDDLNLDDTIEQMKQERQDRKDRLNGLERIKQRQEQKLTLDFKKEIQGLDNKISTWKKKSEEWNKEADKLKEMRQVSQKYDFEIRNKEKERSQFLAEKPLFKKSKLKQFDKELMDLQNKKSQNEEDKRSLKKELKEELKDWEEKSGTEEQYQEWKKQRQQLNDILDKSGNIQLDNNPHMRSNYKKVIETFYRGGEKQYQKDSSIMTREKWNELKEQYKQRRSNRIDKQAQDKLNDNAMERKERYGDKETFSQEMDRKYEAWQEKINAKDKAFPTQEEEKHQQKHTYKHDIGGMTL